MDSHSCCPLLFSGKPFQIIGPCAEVGQHSIGSTFELHDKIIGPCAIVTCRSPTYENTYLWWCQSFCKSWSLWSCDSLAKFRTADLCSLLNSFSKYVDIWYYVVICAFGILPLNVQSAIKGMLSWILCESAHICAVAYFDAYVQVLFQNLLCSHMVCASCTSYRKEAQKQLICV